MRNWYLCLAVLGTAISYSRFIPWPLEHGPDLSLMVNELFSTRIGGFSGLDVLVSAVVLLSFIWRDRRLPYAWTAALATCLVGVSFGLPLLYLRESASPACAGSRNGGAASVSE